MGVSHDAANVGRRIATLRENLGLSQVAFARQAGISRNALIAYERGGRVPKSVNLGRIAGAGGSSVDWLLNGRVAKTAPRDDPEWEAALRALRTAWRDPARRRLAIVVVAGLAQR
jgi:transcriptional regulator with XRE-family HTH domain